MNVLCSIRRKNRKLKEMSILFTVNTELLDSDIKVTLPLRTSISDNKETYASALGLGILVTASVFQIYMASFVAIQ